MDINLVMPYLVVGAFVALTVLGIVARRWQKGVARKLQQANAEGVNFSNAGTAQTNKVIGSLQTAVLLETPVEQAEQLLADLKLPMFWVHPSPREWGTVAAKGDTELATRAVLEADGPRSRVSLTRAHELMSVPVSESEWRKLRARILAAAQSAGVPASEAPAPELIRLPLVDLAGKSPGEINNAPHRWERKPATS